ncbi:MAG: TldD/PmbA family protein [Candidatus Bathyarchaeota archaeon]|nr:MAG: TldD/PmbA family protein [Candidatus Bathyarchaeota archaeon]
MNLDKNWAILKDFVGKAVHHIEAKRNAQVEAFYTSTTKTEVTIRNGDILTQNLMDDSGVGFRVATSKGKVGFACTNAMEEKAVRVAAEKAYDASKTSSEIENFAFAGRRKLPSVAGLFDKRVNEVTVEDAVDIARRAMIAAEDVDKRVIAKDGHVIFQSRWRGIHNTSGVDFEERESKCILYLVGSGKQNCEVTPGCSDSVFSRSSKLTPEKVGRNVGKMVIEMLKPKPLKSFEGTAIFSPEAVSYQPVHVLIDALKASSVMAGRSPWTKEVGNLVASSNLTIIDNSTLSGGFSSRSFDDEGSSSRATVLVDRGRLRSFLHDTTSANTLKAENTANASRSAGGFDLVKMIIGSGYRAKPEIYPSNLLIEGGRKCKEELTSELQNGVLVESMSGFPQAGSGLVSAQLSRAFYVKNGQIEHPIKNGMISGNAFDWFRQISQVGNDAKQFSSSVVPSLQVEQVKMVGL